MKKSKILTKEEVIVNNNPYKVMTFNIDALNSLSEEEMEDEVDILKADDIELNFDSLEDK